ncbi:MAG TPA: hypothetical protein VMY18_13775, partial [Acidobacteriota bacterium]|nr:hypothetical protein [Acidobacteriota bacterium]
MSRATLTVGAWAEEVKLYGTRHRKATETTIVARKLIRLLLHVVLQPQLPRASIRRTFSGSMRSHVRGRSSSPGRILKRL